MDNMEYIDDYFKSLPTDEQKQQFEQRIVSDISFAEDVAFYISANGVIQEQLQEAKKKRFREIYEQQNIIPITKQPVKMIWRYMAAASVAAAIFIITMFLPGKKTSPQELADQYIHENLESADGITMSSKKDSLQTALNLFTTHKLPEALVQFESILKRDSLNDIAKKYAGITSLKLSKYDQAITYFSALPVDTTFGTSGKFLEAVTMLKRNKTGDVDAAIKLLHEVKDKKLEEKDKAGEILKKLE